MKKVLLGIAIMSLNSLFAQTTQRVLSLIRLDLKQDKNNLVIDIKDSNPLKFQIWKGNVMILNASGSCSGEESFPIAKGKYKIVMVNENKAYKFEI